MGLGCVRARGSASAAARDGGGQVRRQTVCVERSCRVAWPRAAGKGRAQDSLQVQLDLRRRSAQCGSGSLHLQEKKRKSIYSIFLPKATLVVKICLEARQLLVAIRLWEGEEKVPVFSFCSPPHPTPGFPSSGKFPGFILAVCVLFEEGCRPKWRARCSNLLNEMS